MTFEYATFEKTIAHLENKPDLHARFLNTISLLEYMGARKILKSQKEEKICSQILAHAAEEIRHAQAFKKLALKMSGGKLTSYSEEHLLCGQEAREYFQSLDQAVHAEFGDDSYTNYLYTTLLIEERANQVYPVYEPILARAGYPGVLKAIVREEDSHLKEILESLRIQDLARSQSASASPAAAASASNGPAPQSSALPSESSGKRNTAALSVDKMIEFRMLETAAFEKFISSVFSTIQDLTQGDSWQVAPLNETDAKPTESQPGLTRGDAQDSRQTIRQNPSHGSGNANVPHSTG